MAQQTITFEETRFAALLGTVFRDSASGGPNEADDSAVSGAVFHIVRGMMQVQNVGSGHNLFFSRFVPNGPDRGTSRLLVHFNVPQHVLSFRLSSDFIGAGSTPVLVQIFDVANAPAGTTPVFQQQFQFGDLPTTVQFASAAQSAVDVLITTASAENSIDDLVFSDDAPVASRDVVATLDGSGSMAQGGKWPAMVEAGALFEDLYRALGNAQDGFGAQLFRWNCALTLGGQQIDTLLPLAPLQTVGDLPAALAAQAPQGCTPIGEAVVGAAAAAQAGANASKAVLLLTDGINNKGRSVADASAASELAQTAVHCVGLGAGAQIDPVAISALAAAHGGQFRATEDPAEVLDFFAQALSQILGKAEMAVVNGDSVVIAPGTTKAVFVAAWTPGGAVQSFDLAAPDGNAFQAPAPAPAGMVGAISFRAGGAGRAHAMFVVEGADLGGSWSFVNLAAATRRLVVEDLALRVNWSIAPKLGAAGEPIVLRASIRHNGRPFTQAVRFDVRVTRPDLSIGELLAAGGQGHKGRVPSADANLRLALATRVMVARKLKALPVRSSVHSGFSAVAPGDYEWRDSDTALDGVYRFDAQVSSMPGAKLAFSRRVSLFAVLVTVPNPAASAVSVTRLADSVWQVVARPAMSKLRPSGPFLAPWVRLKPSSGHMSGALVDLLDGRYGQLLISEGKLKPQVRVEVLGHGRAPVLKAAKAARKAGAKAPGKVTKKAVKQRGRTAASARR